MSAYSIGFSSCCRHIKSYQPEKGSDRSSGYDLKADIPKPIMLTADRRFYAVPTGVKLFLDVAENDISIDAQVRSRSGLAAKHSTFVLNSPGTIDTDYEGEIVAIMAYLGSEAFRIEPEMRIAQLVFSERLPIRLVEGLKNSTISYRKEAGFGSTGLF